MDSQELQSIKNRFGIVGSDAGLTYALETACAIARTDLSVLIEGESGVGKEALPQIIHQCSRRKNGPYLAVNCGSIPVGTINAELFGHEKGAFTGAIAEHKGYFAEADGGTLFLDEIGELPKETQAMLLRVLQSGEYMKVGSSKTEKTNVRVIAATNVNLQHAVATGKFRQDLYYRLDGIVIKMPSLRERKEDIPLLFRKFSSDFAAANGLCKLTLTHDANTALMSYRWPGNIRQLKNFAEAQTALHSKPSSPSTDKVEIDSLTLKAWLPDEQNTLLPAVSGPSSQEGGSFSSEDRAMIVKGLQMLQSEIDELKGQVEALKAGAPKQMEAPREEPVAREEAPEEVEWTEPSPVKPLSALKDAYIFEALDRHDGNVAEAAAELGISERTIYRKLKTRKQ